MSRENKVVLSSPKNHSQETLTNTFPLLQLQRLCAQQSELLLHHDAAFQEELVAIKTAFQPTEDVADGKAEETLEEATRPRCILSYAWPSDAVTLVSSHLPE